MIAAVLDLGFRFADPHWFWLAALLPPWLWWRHRQQPSTPWASALLWGGDAAAPELVALPRARWFGWAALPVAAEVMAFLLAIGALARPVHRLPLPPERLVRDVMLCLDMSSSMAATDLAADRSRQAVALEVAAEFSRQREQDRIGFVTFARFSDLRCPPTLDHDAVAELLAGVAMVEKDSPEDATGIGAALAEAAAALARSPARGKVVVLLTDGEENVATTATPQEIAPLHAAQLCAELGIRVHSIVVGAGRATPDGSFVPLDTTTVRQVAETTGGRFFTARDASALQQVYREIDALEQVAFAEPRARTVEWFALPIGVSLLLIMVAAWLAHGRAEVLP